MSTLLRLSAAMLLVPILFAGCCEECDDPVAPQVGAITINPEPNSIDAPWEITGPVDFSQTGNGNLTLPDMALGSYTVTWGEVTSWTIPSPAVVTQSLTANESVTFTGTYVAQPGTITIDPEPDSVDAPWQITGPNGFSHSGNGDTVLGNLMAGSYTLTWRAVTGWTTPIAATQTLTGNGSLTFIGTYTSSGVPAGFVSVSGGTFTMGSPAGEDGHESNEVQHQVTLTHGFYMHTTEVTNQRYADLAQWAFSHGHCTATSASLRDALDGSTEELLNLDGYCEISFSGGVFTVDAGKEHHPVLEVTWYGAAAYCDWLSLQQGLPRAYNHSTWQCNDGDPYSAAGYRLPAEAEWEYACRAGRTTAFANGTITYLGCAPVDPILDQVGWYCGNANYWTHPVAQKLPNAWGLYDMHGNLYEWCNDCYGPYGGTVSNPVGPASGPYRVIRGGDHYYFSQNCRSADRVDSIPNNSNTHIGFRSVNSWRTSEVGVQGKNDAMVSMTLPEGQVRILAARYGVLLPGAEEFQAVIQEGRRAAEREHPSGHGPAR